MGKMGKMSSSRSFGVVPTPVGSRRWASRAGGVKIEINFKVSRQKCPLHTGVAPSGVAARYGRPLDSRGWLSLHESFCQANFTAAEISKLLLWSFDQFHFAVSGAVEDHYFTLGIAEDEDVAVAEVGFLDSLFEGHGAHGDGLVGADQVNFGGGGDRGIAVYGDRHGGFFR